LKLAGSLSYHFVRSITVQSSSLQSFVRYSKFYRSTKVNNNQYKHIMQLLAVLSLLAAAAVANPVANPQAVETVTVSIPHIATETFTITETAFTATVLGHTETFTVRCCFWSVRYATADHF
jgi:hypothetical protein